MSVIPLVSVKLMVAAAVAAAAAARPAAAVAAVAATVFTVATVTRVTRGKGGGSLSSGVKVIHRHGPGHGRPIS